MNIFDKVQGDLQAILIEQTFFQDIPIVLEHKGDVRSMVQQALAKGAPAQAGNNPKSGVAIVISTPSATDAEPERWDIEIGLPNIATVVSTFEHVTINRGTTGIGKPSLDIIHNLIYYVQRKRERGKLIFKFGGYTSDEDNGIVSYHATFNVKRVINAPA